MTFGTRIGPWWSTISLCACLNRDLHSSCAKFGVGVECGTLQYLPHGLQLSLFLLIGRRELLHHLHQVLLLCMLSLPELPAPQPRLTVRRQEPQPKQLDARLNSCHKTK